MDSTTGLTSKTLSKIPTSNSDKASLVKAFVSSQEQFLRTYASDGRKAVLEWHSEKTGPELSAQSGDNTSIKARTGVFDSPVLKPRKPLQDKCERTDSDHPSKCHKTPSKPVSKRPYDEDLVSAKETAPDIDSTEKNSRKEKKGSRPSGKLDSKRKRCDSDDEKEERLAQRRARREAKKKIIAGPQTESSTKVEVNVQAKSRTKVKENTKQDLPAGLALMHGFSAKNIGRNRITLGADVAVGVFNKGRASLKKQLDKSRKRGATFDETRFLQSAPVKRQHVQKGKIETLKKQNRSRQSTPISTEVDEQPNRGCSESSMVSNTRGSQTPEKGSVISVSSGCSSSSRGKQLTDDPDKSDYKSQVWDIEHEFLPTKNPEERDTSCRKPESVILKSTSWNWSPEENQTIEEAVELSFFENREASNGSRDGIRRADGTSSLAPSQSASQMALKKAVSSMNLEGIQTTSKFFVGGEKDVTPCPDGSKSAEKLDLCVPSGTPCAYADFAQEENLIKTETISTFNRNSCDDASISRSLLAEVFQLDDNAIITGNTMPALHDTHFLSEERNLVLDSPSYTWSDFLQLAPNSDSKHSTCNDVDAIEQQTHNILCHSDYMFYGDPTFSESYLIDDPYDSYMQQISEEYHAGDLEETDYEVEATHEVEMGDLEDLDVLGDLPIVSGAQRPIDSFLQGRSLLLGLGMDGLNTGLDSTQSTQYAGSLESVEALVASTLQKSWYPVKY